MLDQPQRSSLGETIFIEMKLGEEKGREKKRERRGLLWDF